MGKDSKQDDPEYKARSVALRLLARREHSRHELSLKLRQRRIDQNVIDLVLDDYESEGWLNDARFADVYARQRIDVGYGPVRIMAELQQRGVNQRPECLEGMTDSDWCRLAAKLRDKRFGLQSVAKDLPEKFRQARFLARRGFSSAQIEMALNITDLDEIWGSEA